MTSAPLSAIQSLLHTELLQVQSALETLFGASAEEVPALALCAQTAAELRGIAAAKPDAPIIAVIGSKNVGKTWLCRHLILHEPARSALPCGFGIGEGTARVTWIGPARALPPLADLASELAIPVDADQLVDLGAPYLLLDMPGYNDATVPTREAALRAVSGAALRVLIVSTQTLEDESQFAWLIQSDGTRILPMVVDQHYPAFTQEAARGDLVRLRERIAHRCPQAEVLEPLVIPHYGYTGLPESDAEQLFLPKLRELVAMPPPDPVRRAQICLNRFRGELSRTLAPMLEHIGPYYRGLLAEEERVAGNLTAELLGAPGDFAMTIRAGIRQQLLARTPPLFFPYRTFLGLLTLTAGAWDRLFFSLVGSLPSLALLAAQTSRNLFQFGNVRKLASLERAREKTKSALQGQAEASARVQLATSNAAFVNALTSHFPQPGQADRGLADARVRFVGLESLAIRSAAIFREVAARFAPGAAFNWFFGLPATLIFCTLAAGPLTAVYRSFLFHWWGAVSPAGYNPDTGWMLAFPDWWTFLHTLMLTMLPAAVLAMVALAASVQAGRVAKAGELVKAEHEGLLKGLVEEKAIRLESDDPAREAVRTLLDFTGAIRQQ